MRRAEEGRVQGWGTGCELPRPAFSLPRPPSPRGARAAAKAGEPGEKASARGAPREVPQQLPLRADACSGRYVFTYRI